MKAFSILFIEDDESIRMELGHFLKRYAGEHLYVGRNGKEGLELYEQHHPDLVISDIKMPLMNGIDMAKAIKERDPDQAIIFTSAHSDSSFFLEAIDMQVDGYILKPVDLKILDRKIEKLHKQIRFQKEYELQKIITEEIAYLQGNMLVVLDENGEKIFANRRFLSFWNVSSIDELDAKGYFMNQRFVKKEGSFYPCCKDQNTWLEEIRALEPGKRVVSIMDMDEEVRSYKIDIIDVKESGHTIIIFYEITDIVLEKEHYREKSLLDELTQLANRSMFNHRLDVEIQSALHQHRELSLILFDLDHFKGVNDRHGHLVGDEVLRELSAKMRTLVQEDELLARWGGEEFVVLLPDTGVEGAKHLAEKMRHAIEKSHFAHGEELTCSFGISTLSEKDETSITLFRRADDALYTAKMRGRNRVEVL